MPKPADRGPEGNRPTRKSGNGGALRRIQAGEYSNKGMRKHPWNAAARRREHVGAKRVRAPRGQQGEGGENHEVPGTARKRRKTKAHGAVERDAVDAPSAREGSKTAAERHQKLAGRALGNGERTSANWGGKRMARRAERHRDGRDAGEQLGGGSRGRRRGGPVSLGAAASCRQPRRRKGATYARRGRRSEE